MAFFEVDTEECFGKIKVGDEIWLIFNRKLSETNQIIVYLVDYKKSTQTYLITYSGGAWIDFNASNTSDFWKYVRKHSSEVKLILHKVRLPPKTFEKEWRCFKKFLKKSFKKYRSFKNI